MRISDWSSDVCSSDLAMAKEAIRGLTRVAAREWGADGITVNNILPIARTDSYDATTQDDEGQASWVPDTPIARLGSPDEDIAPRSEEHTSALQSLMRISYAVFCLTKKKKTTHT